MNIQDMRPKHNSQSQRSIGQARECLSLEIQESSREITPAHPPQTRGQKPRSRFAPEPVAGLRLEARDKELLANLFLHQAMSRGQIQALYFQSVVRCNVRLRQLFDHGYVSRYYLPAAPFGAQATYSIGKAAIPLVARELELDMAEVSKQYRRTRTPTFIEHTLEIVNLMIAFRAAVSRHPDIEIERWVPEMLCRHEYEIQINVSQRWLKEVFKPDGFVRFTTKSRDRFWNYFIEVDMGHTSARQFLGKLDAHQRYLESGLFKEIYGCQEFKTAVITTSPGRLANLQGLVESQQSRLFQFTTFTRIQDSGILAPIWQVPLEHKGLSLLIDK